VRARLIRLLEHPRLPWLAAGLAALLCLPALGSGLFSDDYVHRAVIRGAGPFPAAAQPLRELFTFVHPRAAHLEAWRELGIFPWWTDPELSIAFFRPVAAATHLLDMAAWPDALALQHAHSIAWLALAVGLAALLYRRVGGAGAAMGLAAVLFAVEDAHAVPAAWIANRNALVALSLGIAGLLAHLRWRRSHRALDLLLALGTMTLALLSGEAALGALAYLLAWQLTMEPGPWRARLRPVAPYAALVLAWRGLYEALGYGVRGSGLYIDPGHQPLDWARAVLERVPVMLCGQWLQAPLDAWVILPRGRQLAAAGAGALFCAGLLMFFLPLLRRRAEARFWALGMALSLLPLAATFPMDRLLIFAGLGAAPLLALLLDAFGWLGGRPILVGGRARRAGLALLLLLQLPFAALLLPVKAGTSVNIMAPVPALQRTFEEVERLEDRTVVLINGHDLLDLALCYTFAETLGHPPGRILQLGSVTTPLRVTRIDPHTLELEQAGGLLGMAFDTLFRSPEAPFAVGQRVERPDAVVEILEITPDGRPLRWRARFEAPLEDPRYHFLRFDVGEALHWRPPPVGQSEQLELALHRLTAPEAMEGNQQRQGRE
jgi:hypothetical protein